MSPHNHGLLARLRAHWSRAAWERGLLTTEQHLEWEGRWPQHLTATEIALRLEQAHFCSVERFSLGLVRCRRAGARVTCRLPGRLVALAFDDDATETADRRVERRWRIVPGLLARRPRPAPREPAWRSDAGTLAIGLEVSGVGRLRAWLRVSACPSRFVAPLPALPAPLRWSRVPWTAVAAVYTFYHAQAAYSGLRRIARLTTSGHES